MEPRLGRGVEQRLRPRIAVRVDGVTVEVAAEPSLARLRERLRIGEPRDADGPPGRADARIEPDLDAPVAAAWTDLVGTDEHLPPAGADLPVPVEGFEERPPAVRAVLHGRGQRGAGRPGALEGGGELVVGRARRGPRRRRQARLHRGHRPLVLLDLAEIADRDEASEPLP